MGKEFNDLPHGVGISFEHQFTVFEGTSRDFCFSFFENDNTIFEFTMNKGFPIQFNLLVRKFIISVQNLIAIHEFFVLCSLDHFELRTYLSHGLVSHGVDFPQHVCSFPHFVP
jgi:hypothetical protein